MTKQVVEAKLANQEETVAAEYDFGDNLAESVALFGEEVVYSRYKSAAVIDLQSFMRGLIRQEKTPEEIAAAVAEWKPGVRKATGKSKEEKVRELLQGLTAEDREAILREYVGA